MLDDLDESAPRGHRACPICGGALRPEILDDRLFLVAWSCVECGIVDTTEPSG